MYIDLSPLLLKMCLMKTELVCKCLCKKRLILTKKRITQTYQPVTTENCMYQRRTLIPEIPFFSSNPNYPYPTLIYYPSPMP